jgi:hypothetical protein
MSLRGVVVCVSPSLPSALPLFALLCLQPIVAKAASLSVSELDGAIEHLRNNARRCKSDVDALHRANEETGSVADDAAAKALATATATLGQADQVLQAVRACCVPFALFVLCYLARPRPPRKQSASY